MFNLCSFLITIRKYHYVAFNRKRYHLKEILIWIAEFLRYTRTRVTKKVLYTSVYYFKIFFNLPQVWCEFKSGFKFTFWYKIHWLHVTKDNLFEDKKKSFILKKFTMYQKFIMVIVQNSYIEVKIIDRFSYSLFHYFYFVFIILFDFPSEKKLTN